MFESVIYDRSGLSLSDKSLRFGWKKRKGYNRFDLGLQYIVLQGSGQFRGGEIIDGFSTY